MNEPTKAGDGNETIAAVDLGSNSFHMIVGRLDNKQLVIVDRLRDAVRLGAGLSADKSLDDAAWERAIESLSRMGQRLRGLPHHAVRAVGTNTMRQINDGGAFLRAAQDALGHPIEIIGGREEARLVYLGVAHGLATGEETRLVVDIGGGSTELILGQALAAQDRESLFMGCVSMTRRFFNDGAVDRDTMERAILAGRIEVRPVCRMFDRGRWQAAVGSSGTIKAIQRVSLANGWSDDGITRSSLKKIRRALAQAGHIDRLELAGLPDDRRPVFAGGVAVLSAVFKSLDIERMQVSELALREGLLYEMVGSVRHSDVRDNTIKAIEGRFGIDSEQADRVESTANTLLEQVAENWALRGSTIRQMLRWACRLHEIGLVISHAGFQKHGAYIIENSDLPGFSRQQQAILARLVRAHRRKFVVAEFDALPEEACECAKRLAVLLRLSVLMHRGRSGSLKPPMKVTAYADHITVNFPDEWLAEHPLTEAEISREAEYLQTAGITLSYA